MKFLFPLLPLFLGASAYPNEPEAFSNAQNQVLAIKDALASNDKDLFFKLVSTGEQDQIHYDHFREVFSKFGMQVRSAKMENGVLVADIDGNGVYSGVIFMRKNPLNPTGWSVYAVGKRTPNKPAKSRMAWGEGWFTMCYVGILWCAIELIVDAMDG